MAVALRVWAASHFHSGAHFCLRVAFHDRGANRICRVLFHSQVLPSHSTVTPYHLDFAPKYVSHPVTEHNQMREAGHCCICLSISCHRVVRVCRELQRLENLSRSPLTSQISESIEGSATIRAYSAVNRHIESHVQLLDRNGQALLSLKTAEVSSQIGWCA